MPNLRIIVGETDYSDLITGTPTITEQVASCCRVMKFSIQLNKKNKSLLGKTVKLLYKNKVWFIGTVRKQGKTSDGKKEYTCYDPLYFLAHYTDDFYFKKQTGTQIIKTLAKKCGIKVYKVAAMRVTFPRLYYQGAASDKVFIDILARMKKANGTKYWYRYHPEKDGLYVFKRSTPSTMWAFKTGINLLSASKTDDIEARYTQVKVINRETGKSVTKYSSSARKKYGKTQDFEEVNKETKNLSKFAKSKLKSLNVTTTTMAVSGLNPNGEMGQFWVAMPVYVEEANTGLAAAYYIKNVTQTFLDEDMIRLDMDIQLAPELPVIQFDDATTAKPKSKSSKKKK